jgi:hypothetical protein
MKTRISESDGEEETSEGRELLNELRKMSGACSANGK